MSTSNGGLVDANRLKKPPPLVGDAGAGTEEGLALDTTALAGFFGAGILPSLETGGTFGRGVGVGRGAGLGARSSATALSAVTAVSATSSSHGLAKLPPYPGSIQAILIPLLSRG